MTLRSRSGRGFSSIELSMTIAILGMVIGAFYGAYNGFLRDVAFAESLGDLERETRPVVNGLVIELRQATAPNAAANGQGIEFMSQDKIVFYSDRRSASGPEQFTYERTNCVDGLCELVMSFRFADSGSKYPNFTHISEGEPDFEVSLLEGIPETVRLFQGVALAGSTEVFIDECDRLDSLGGGATACAFDKIIVNVEVAPSGAGVRPRNFVVTEEVQLRNSSF